jgi:hypothetical protein
MPAPTLSAGEYKLSEGELKVSGRRWACLTIPRSSLEAQNGLPLLLVAFSRLLSRPVLVQATFAIPHYLLLPPANCRRPEISK